MTLPDDSNIDAAAAVSQARRIALLTPYNGDNFGDGAIFEATMQGLRRVMPAAEFVGITLSPADTLERHGIASVPLSGEIENDYYSHSDAASDGSYTDEAGASLDDESPGAAREAVKSLLRVTGVLPLLKGSIQGARRIQVERRHAEVARDLLRDVDLLVVAGGGQLDEEWGGPWGHPWSLAKWSGLARKAGVPVVHLGLGVCKLESSTSHRLARRALRGSKLLTCRDEGSLELVRSLSDTPARLGPDLAFGLDVDRWRTQAAVASGEARRVAVSPIAYGFPDLWPTLEPELAERYLAGLVGLVESLTRAGWLVDIVTSVTGTDVIIADRMYRAISNEAKPRVRNLAPECETLEGFLDRVAACDAVIASRLHGVILSHLLAKPTLAITYDRKVDAHMDRMQQSGHCVPIATATAESLMKDFETLVSTPGVPAGLDDRTAGFRAELEAQYAELPAAIGWRDR